MPTPCRKISPSPGPWDLLPNKPASYGHTELKPMTKENKKLEQETKRQV